MAENSHRRGPGPVPERWLRCPRKSTSLLINKFVAFKAPLDSRFDDQVPPAYRWSPSMLLDSLKSSKMKLGLWIDLTRTDRFYNRKEIEDAGCTYVKIECHGHEGPPTEEQTNTFVKICTMFISKEPLSLIGVHCTHGFNRTGFLLVSFLVEHIGNSVDVSIREFAKLRPPGIYKEQYIKELFRRYDDESYALSAPPLPDWCHEEEPVNGSEGDADQGNGGGGGGGGKKKRGSRNNICKFKDNPTFMEGVPGVEPITDRDEITRIRQQVQRLTDYPNDGFVGSQPVSMDRANIRFLTQKPYRVSWKADGTRYMMFIAGKDQIYFIDRDNSVFKVEKLQFFNRKTKNHLTNTLLDGEMVIDKDANRSYPRYLVYDIVFFDNNYVGDQHFYPIRLKLVEKDIIEPRVEAMKDGRVRKEREPFSVRLKPFYEISKSVDLLGETFAKQLTHEPDGLIFQPSEDPYTYGTSPNVLKWKPLSMNSIDFKLKVEKETRMGYVNPYVGILLTSDGLKFGELSKLSKNVKMLNGKIIECKYENNQWVFMRERTDKSFPNSRSTANSVFTSIRYPVTECMLLELIDREGWKDPMPPPMAPPPKKIRTN